VANTLTNVLPQLLAQGLMALRQNAILPQLVNKSYDTLAQQKGNVINVPIPSAIAARAITPSITQNSNVDSSPTTATVTLDWWYEAPFQMSDNDMVSASTGMIPMQASEAIKSLGNAVDAYIWGKHIGIFNIAGTAGTHPFSGTVTMITTARKLLNKSLAPMTDRVAVLGPDAEANLLSNGEVLNFYQRGDQGGIINGEIGRKFGFNFFMDQNIPTFSPGPAASAITWVVGTNSGLLGTSTLQLYNATATSYIEKGDIFTINGQAQQYVVTATIVVVSAVSCTVAIYPPLKTTDAAGVSVTFVNALSDYTPNLVMHRDAFAFASRPLAGITGTGGMFMSQTDPVSGISLRLEVSRQYKQTVFSYDILCGAGLVRPELAAKIAGGS
jgi:hypothetical protein